MSGDDFASAPRCSLPGPPSAPRCSLPGAPAYGAPVAPGTVVLSSDGVEVGTVEASLDNYREQIFTGVIFRDGAGALRYCDGGRPGSDRTGAPVLELDAPAAEVPGLPSPGTAFDQIAESGKRLAEQFARALAALDYERVEELMHPEVSFRAVTPGRSWEATGAREVVANVFPGWFWEGDELVELEHLEVDAFADRIRVGYRVRGRNATDGEFLFEQQAYLGERDGRIGWMLVACSGFRPVGGPPPR